MNNLDLLNSAVFNVLHSFEFDFPSLLVDNIDAYELDEISEYDDEIIFEMIDRMCIYYNDQWIIARHYVNSPFEVDKDDILMQLFNDISEIIEEYKRLEKCK